MENFTTLSSIFNDTKSELASSLSGLMLPKDLQKIQDCISQYLNNVCGEDNEYRQNLTQSEDYILQAALSMLNAQRNMVSALSTSPKVEVLTKNNLASEQINFTKSTSKTSISAPNVLLGSGGGALVGNIIFGGWGAVFGAIAGTAVALYVSQQSSQPSNSDSTNEPDQEKYHVEAKITDMPVDVNKLVNVVGQLCDSLDRLISTFRAQIQRVINKYESQEKPTIEREYRVLLEGIQSLVGYKRGHSTEDPKYLGKLQTRIEDLVDLLENYDLVLLDYSSDTSDLFEELASPNVTEPKMVVPAIMKNGDVIIRGKVFVKAEK